MEINGTTYHDETPAEVANILEAIRRDGDRVRIHYGNRTTGVLWGDVAIGTLGRSMGPKKVPIILANSSSTGGEALMDHHILLIESTTKSKGVRKVFWKNSPLEGSNECPTCGELRTNVLRCRCERVAAKKQSA